MNTLFQFKLFRLNIRAIYWPPCRLRWGTSSFSASFECRTLHLGKLDLQVMW